MNTMNRLFALAMLVHSTSTYAQEKTGIAIDPSAKNVAALFTMTDEGGRIRNLELMESVFKDGTLGFVSERHHNVSSPYIYKRLGELASSLEDGATLLLYFNSHGGGSWDKFAMTAQGGSLKFKKVIEELGRPGRKIKRLIVLVDTCHAEGSIQDSVGQDGELLRNIKAAKFLPELPDKYSQSSLPFISFFLERIETDDPRGRKVLKIVGDIDYGLNSGVYEQMLIISSSSVEDLSVRGTFASKFASAFNSIKSDNSATVMDFLKKFADSHSLGEQQPHYKMLPDKSMLSELMFGPWPAQTITIRDARTGSETNNPLLIPIPSR